jgi:small-conductance mechanosensitive channel
MPTWTSWTILGNDPLRWGLAALVFLFSALMARAALRIALRRVEALAQRTHNGIDDMVAQTLGQTKTPFLLLVALWLGSRMLTLPEPVDRGIERFLVIGVLIQFALFGTGAARSLIHQYAQRQLEVDPGGTTAVGAISFISRTFIWAVVLLLILDNLEIDITALVAGLGIGGIAVALALQNVLSDLFASLSIVLDKPFVVGDFVAVGEFLGTVEYVGLKTTRLRSLSGEQIVFSNSDLLGSRLRNYKRLRERRAVFQIGVTYDTPESKLRAIPGLLRGIVEGQANTRFDRAHFRSYGPYSLDFEIVYFVLRAEYNDYMDIQQAINFEIFTRFQREGIEFAFPTQTVLVRAPQPGGTGVPDAVMAR